MAIVPVMLKRLLSVVLVLSVVLLLLGCEKMKGLFNDTADSSSKSEIVIPERLGRMSETRA